MLSCPKATRNIHIFNLLIRGLFFRLICIFRSFVLQHHCKDKILEIKASREILSKNMSNKIKYLFTSESTHKNT